MADKSDCIEWQGAVSSTGYGHRNVKGKTKKIHRLAMEKHLGRELHPTELVCHRCDNPLCYNINHLFLGTDRTNMEDKVKKGRQHRPCGELNGAASLTENQVKEILKDSQHSQVQLAKKYGVYQSTISSIKLRKTWKHIQLEDV